MVVERQFGRTDHGGVLLYWCQFPVACYPGGGGPLCAACGDASRTVFTIVASGAVIAWALLALVATPYMTGTDFFHWISQSSSESIAAGIGGISSGLEDRLALVSEGWAEYREHPMGLGPHGMRSSGVEKMFTMNIWRTCTNAA